MAVRVNVYCTETLQVVKMGERDLDGFVADMHPVAVRKRSVRERLGEYVDFSDEVDHKRFRGDPRSVYAVDESFHPSKDDLRHKIMQKNRLKGTPRYSQRRDYDLRNFLSRPTLSPRNSTGVSDNARGRKFPGIDPLESKDYIEWNSDIMDGSHSPPITSGRSSQSKAHSWVERDHREEIIAESREDRRGLLEVGDFRHRMLKSFSASMRSDLPGMGPSYSTLQGEPGANLYSSWNLDQLRKRSPDETFLVPSGDEAMRRRYPLIYSGMNSSRNKDVFEVASKRDDSHSPWNLDQLRKRSPEETFVAPTRDEPMRRRSRLDHPGMNTSRKKDIFEVASRRENGMQRRHQVGYGDTNTSRSETAFGVEPNREESVHRGSPLSYNEASTNRKEDSFEISRPKSMPYSANAGPTIRQTVNVLPMPQSLPESGAAPQGKLESPKAPDSVESFLHSLGLERFAIHFKAEEVDMYSLKRMSESDLVELGIPMGPRKQIIFALKSLLRESSPQK